MRQFAFHERYIGGIDAAIYRYIIAKVGNVDRLAGFRLGLGNIGSVPHRSVAGGVANKHAHWRAHIQLIVPLFTFVRVTVIVCAFVTPVRLTVTVFVPLPVEDETLPTPEATDAPE